jgi:ribosome-associated protein
MDAAGDTGKLHNISLDHTPRPGFMSEQDRPSKTRRKKDVHELQELGEELVSLADDRLSGLELPERLRDAVTDARRIKSHEARRRQIQYIGKLMRGVDPAPIRAALEGWRAQSDSRVLAQKRVEAWRRRLLEDDRALAELLAGHPGADAGGIRSLVLDALHERETNQPPRAYRALYQALRALLEEREQ